MKKNHRKTEHYEMWIDEGIIHTIYARDLNICLEMAKSMVFDRVQICKGRDLPLIVKLNRIVLVDPEAREFLSIEGIKYVSRLAILATNNMDKLIAEVWKDINSPNAPTRIFDKQKQALKWLNRYQLRITG